jgi:hypothetical protein
VLLGACGSGSAAGTRAGLDGKYCAALARLNDLTLLHLYPPHRTPEETAELLGPVADEFRTLATEYGDLGLETQSALLVETATGIDEYRTVVANSTIGDEAFAVSKITHGTRQMGIPCPS